MGRILAVGVGVAAVLLTACGDDDGGGDVAAASEPGTAVVELDGETHEGSAECGTEAGDVVLEAGDVSVVVVFGGGESGSAISVASDGDLSEVDPDSINLTQEGPIDALVGELDGDLVGGGDVSASWACPAT